ncbi:MAG TPA: pyruvate formate lyase family protein [Armatimonadota bacterium]|jgi:formate C-acetyltransferase
MIETAPTVSNSELLRSLGEWAALGLYENKDLPWPLPYGKAYRALYEQMDITMPEGRLLLPHEPLPHARHYASDNFWYATSLMCGIKHHTGLTIDWGMVREQQEAHKEYSAQLDTIFHTLDAMLPYFGGYTHSNPDMRRVVCEGFLAMEAELHAEIAALQASDVHAETEELRLLLTLQDYAGGVRAFHTRTVNALRAAAATASAARRQELELIADSLAHAFLYPAETFLQGLLAVNFTWMLDGCDSIGRVDQVLGPLFDRDVQEGRIDLVFVRRLLDELWQNFERFNAWNLQIGGYTPDGRDGTNALTLECIDACGRNHLRRPNVAFRITRQTPDDALLRALRALADGSGRPALYNDDCYVETLHSLPLGLSQEDAREIGFGGCTETMIAGMSNVGSLEGEVNLAKALELALHDGYDPVHHLQVGPHTGRFADMADFTQVVRAVERQVQYLTDAFVAKNKVELEKRFQQGDPKLARTLFTRDCVERHRSFEAGGARYNWSIVSYQGIAQLIDSMAAIRACVYETPVVTREELLAALADDFVGHDVTRRALLAAPKYGNDDARVDALGRDLLTFAWEELAAHETPRGGRYLASCILFATYQGAGQQVGATPDGRKAFTVLTDSVGPVQGRDVNGPTAMLRSVTTLPLHLAIGTPVLNVRFQKSLLATEIGVRAVADMIRSYFAQGGLQIQLSVLDAEELRAAQQNPEQYRDLIVRIGGYSEYFVALSRELQDSVIARTEY